MRYISFPFLLSIGLLISCSSSSPLDVILQADNAKIKRVMENPDSYQVQILYTQIDRDKQGKVSLTDYGYQVDDSLYFYPASTVKFPVALLALEKINELKAKNISINLDTPFRVSSDSIVTTLRKEITKIFTVSSNAAYNRLFEFLGQDYINEKLKQKEIAGRITHRLGAPFADSLITKEILFYESEKDSSVIFRQSPIRNTKLDKLNIQNVLKGDGYIENESLVMQPKDFSEKNYLPLRSLHGMLKRIYFPDLFSEDQRFKLTKEQLNFIIKTMKTLPYEKGYNRKEYYDSYGKFFMFGDTKTEIPKYIEIYNKVGYAYGHLTDCAYIKDVKNDIEFLTTATILVNENGIYNDDQYEYDEIGIPFLAELGRSIYQTELEKK